MQPIDFSNEAWLIYSDWLEEQNRLGEAEVIRSQLEFDYPPWEYDYRHFVGVGSCIVGGVGGVAVGSVGGIGGNIVGVGVGGVGICVGVVGGVGGGIGDGGN